MNAMTCEQVQDQLDLMAADACDAPTRQTLERHLEQCPACAASYAESRRLLGLLDLHFDQRGPERLRQRIERDARRARWAPFVRAAVAVAALLLITVGLTWLMSSWVGEPEPAGPQLALVVRVEKTEATLDRKVLDLGTPGSREKLVDSVRGNAGLAKLRHQMLLAQAEGKLPPPPAFPLALAFMNTGKRTVEVRLGDTATELALEVQGEGAVRIPAPAAEEPAFLRPQALHLDPGQQHAIHIDRLIEGKRGHLEYVYLTRPGEYMLTARLRLTADGRAVTVTGEAVRIQVGK
jgi:hypothetical protein